MMTELAKAKRRIKQLERCLRDVVGILADRDEELERFHGVEEDSPQRQTMDAVFRRVRRTLR
jgi:hypothetical protein